MPRRTPEPTPRVVFLHRQPDGTFVDWGRHTLVGGVRGSGPALWYRGEAAEVMRLVLEHTRPRDGAGDGPSP